MKKIKSGLLILIFLATGCGAFGKFTSTTSDAPADPLLKYAWHIDNTGQKVFATLAAVVGIDLNLSATWTSEVYGKDVIVQISDDGIEDTHQDLQDNFPYYSYSKNYLLASPYTATTSRPNATTDNHGTAVAGLVAALGFNGAGSRGVAPKAKLVSANFLSDSVTRDQLMYLDQISGSYDISNMSWGGTQNSVFSQDTTYAAQLNSMVTSGRSNKGTIFVKAAGNDFVVTCRSPSTDDCIGNSNFDEDNTTPYMIMVGALNALGESASYSSVGSNLWISSFGGEFGGQFNGDSPAMVTTDRMGCSAGYSGTDGNNNFETGASSENSGCNYTTQFNGTSSAAPILTGVVALLLEANPSLTWREVKYILAKTATVDNESAGSIPHPLGETMPVGYVWEQQWITNAASFKFHNWYGFGRVNVDAAVALAKSALVTPIGLGTYTDTNWDVAHRQSDLGLAIPDFTAAGVSTDITVATNIKVEAVQIALTIDHTDVSELAVEITSPSGTKSIVINGQNSLTALTRFHIGQVFLSNAFYQESTVGVWRIKVIDTKAGGTGNLEAVRLNFVGGP